MLKHMIFQIQIRININNVKLTYNLQIKNINKLAMLMNIYKYVNWNLMKSN